MGWRAPRREPKTPVAPAGVVIPASPTPAVRVHTGLAAASPAWTALEATAPHHPWQTRAWLQAWLAHVGRADGIDPVVIEVSGPDGAPWLVWPLGRRRRGPLVELCGLGRVIADYQGPLISPDCPDALLTADAPAWWSRALAAMDRVDVLRLERLPATLGGRPHPARALGAQRFPADSHAATLEADWETLFKKRCSSRTRGKLRTKFRKLASHGALTFEVADTPQARLALLPEAMALKSAGYAALGVPDLFAHAGRRALLEQLAAQDNSPLHLSVLRVGDTVAATHLGVVHDGCLYFLFPGYRRDELARFSPGEALSLRLLEHACEQGFHTVDFTLGDEPYKDRWCDRVEHQYVLHDAVTRRGRAVAAARQFALESRARIKANPELADRARAARSLAGKLRDRLP